MSIACDKCNEEGTEDNPVFYIESYLRGVGILESVRDLEMLKDPPMNPFADPTTPCTLHLHRVCAAELHQHLCKQVVKFIEPPKEKSSGKKERSSSKRKKS